MHRWGFYLSGFLKTRVGYIAGGQIFSYWICRSIAKGRTNFWKTLRLKVLRYFLKIISNFCRPHAIHGNSQNTATLQSLTGPVQGQNRDFPVKFSHTWKNFFSLQGTPFLITGISLWEKLHRENPVFITGKGLQCRNNRDRGLAKLP